MTHADANHRLADLELELETLQEELAHAPSRDPRWTRFWKLSAEWAALQRQHEPADWLDS